MLCLKGLIVVDAFQTWCGPCKTAVDLFRKIRNEVGSDLLCFAVAEVDSIDALGKYRGKCKPVFLFYSVTGRASLEHPLICFSHLSGRRISSCCERSECTIAAEDHPGTAGSRKEGFGTRRTACGGNQGKVQCPQL
uniref:Thioredoxin domain-containing protein n=1 Tax=Falco tinnunculus TaxID=100819 RepID=A0A8C4UPF1_FALTI